MKYIAALFAILFSFASKAQLPAPQATVPAYDLQVGWHKTTLLIFPAPIKRGVRGDKYLLAEQLKDVDNILQVKAGQKGFEQSNLNVVTTDGKVYVFNVTYSEDAPSQPIYVDRLPPYAPATFEGLSMNAREIEIYAGQIAVTRPFLKAGKFGKYGLKFVLEGSYIRNDVLFLRYNMRNSTNIKYEAASMRFFVRDKKKSKRTAEQDSEIQPVLTIIKGKPEDTGGQTLIVAFPKFTIADKKQLWTEVMEKDGDRNVLSSSGQKELLKARPLR